MTVIAVNGSPRKNWNTHTLLTKALEGASVVGAHTELINLYELNYKGCISCLKCKLKDENCAGKCAMNDELTPLLAKIAYCDALILGSPIYFGEVTGIMRSFMERLLFPYLSYDKERTPLFKRRMPTAFIYTMNAPKDVMEKVGYTERFEATKTLFEWILGPSEILISTETLQIDDYSKYNMSMVSEEKRKQRHNSVFPKDCQLAQELGKRIAR